MKQIFTVLLILLVGITGHAIADDLPTDQELEELVIKLDDSSRLIRQRAVGQILKLGPSVIDSLEESAGSLSVIGQKELQGVMRQLKARQTQVSQRVPELQLPETSLTLNEAVSLITEQSGYELEFSPELMIDRKSIRFSAQKLSYWSAMIELLDHYQLDLAVDKSGRVYVLKERTEPRTYFISNEPGSDPPSSAYRITRITRKEIVGQEDFELLRINFQVLFAPSRQPFYIQVSGNQKMVCTRLKEFPEAEYHVAPYSPEAFTELPCQLQLISPEFRVDWLVSKRFHPESADLTLDTETLQAVDIREFTFEDWSKTRDSQRLGLAVVTRDEVSLDEKSLSVLMLVLHSDRGDPFESHREWMSQTKIRLTDGTQEISPSRPAEKVLEADGTTALRFTFPRPDSPLDGWKLKYQLPTDFKKFHHSVRTQIDLKTWIELESNE